MFKTGTKKALYDLGKKITGDPFHQKGEILNAKEYTKNPSRTSIINYLIESLCRDTTYLEIGVRNPDDNFNLVKATNKISVDPGLEFVVNPVDFNLTSDVFFQKLDDGEILDKKLRFDLIFIDGLHLAEQADRDIQNSLKYLTEDGFIVVHDCNPPSEYHAREEFEYQLSPARGSWNGTTWKAFYKTRLNKEVSTICIDSDWGVGVISKKPLFNFLNIDLNPFYEYTIFDKNRKSSLNLVTFEELQAIFSNRNY